MEPNETEIRAVIVATAADIQKSAAVAQGTPSASLRKDAERLLEWCRELEKKK